MLTETVAAASGGLGEALGAAMQSILTFLLRFPSPQGSIVAMGCALVIAVAFLAWRRGRGWQWRRAGRILKVLFSSRYVAHRSHRLDLLYTLASLKVIGLAIGWFVLSGAAVTLASYEGLITLFGERAPSSWPRWLVLSISAAVLFLAYELAYWTDHTLSHRVPFLWEFHKVHHQAEVLSPLTVYRVHPVDSLVFANIMVLVMGPVSGGLHFAFGMAPGSGIGFSHGAIMIVFVHLVVQLQHSHIWIPFCGIWGRIFMSPAHHQIHHSTNPLHFDRNMGSCLALFDWLFGTLHVPARKREKLTFGVDTSTADPHSVMEGVVAPFGRGVRHLVPAPVVREGARA